MKTATLRTSALVALSILLVGVVAHAQRRPPRINPGGPVQIGPSQSAPTIGWPHDVRSGSITTCDHAPSSGEVILSLHNGQCMSLVPGFYTTLNDVSQTWAVTGIKVGSDVRARAFWLEHFSQNMDRAFIMYSPGATLSLSGDAQTIRSMRVEPASRSLVCNDLQEGEIALFEGWDGAGDCVVLPVGQYPSADTMGIANDSISGVNNQTGMKAVLFWNASFNKQGAVVSPHTRLPRLPQGGHFSDTIDNQTSSMQMLPP